MNQIGQILQAVNIPPITVKIDEESSASFLKNVFITGLLLGTALIVIYFSLSSQLKK